MKLACLEGNHMTDLLHTLLPILFIAFLLLAALSALIFLQPCVPLSYVRVHMGLLTLPPLISLGALIMDRTPTILGPFRFYSLSWLIALFVLTIGLIVQRYSVRYLLGDRHYRGYFAFLSFITFFDAFAWVSDDIRLMLVFWGAVLLSLTLLIRLNHTWRQALWSSALAGRVFSLSWLFLLVAIVWLVKETGSWHWSQLSAHVAQLHPWSHTGMTLLLVMSVMIPAAQFPFQSWLLNSVVTPTPVSAIMHAGIVNVGGILLTVAAPLFTNALAQTVLLIASGLSVLLGTGIMLVQPDYKRQLVGSTIAQMGFMLVQCALGAFAAAITHAVLHGLFKATLFLQSGNALQHAEKPERTGLHANLWRVLGLILGIAAGVIYWTLSPDYGYRTASAVILGWSLAIAWTQLTAYDYGRLGRLINLGVLCVAGLMFFLIHLAFYHLLNGIPSPGPSTPLVIILLILLIGASLLAIWVKRQRHSKLYTWLYLWLIRIGEAHPDAMESHPKYLTQLMSKGGPTR